MESKHKFEYYSKFSLAVTDVNNDEIGVNADVDRPDAVAGIYTEEGEAPTVVLFTDTTETNTIMLASDININLGGNTLSFDNSVTGFDTTANNNNQITIDGSIKDSEIIIVNTANGNATALQLTAGNNVEINNGTYTAVANTGRAMPIYSNGGTLSIKNSILSCFTEEQPYLYSSNL